MASAALRGASRTVQAARLSRWRQPQRRMVAHADRSAPSDGPGSGRPPKRKVALFVGYVGSAYRGLQLSSGEGQNGVVTVEGVLRQALLAAGGLSDANAEDMVRKANWKRSSRTDKGVHSTMTVLSLKMELWPAVHELADEYQAALDGAVAAAEVKALATAAEEESEKEEEEAEAMDAETEADVDAAAAISAKEATLAMTLAEAAAAATHARFSERVAADLNAHLPRDVRVFGAMKTVKSFDARSACVRRAYEYAFPAQALPDGGSKAELERLNAALAAFVGVHPFHNFTKRRQYQAQAAERMGRIARRRDSEATDVAGGSAPVDQSAEGDSASPPIEADDTVRVTWSETIDPRDRVVKELYRGMTAAAATLEEAPPGSGRCVVAVRLTGESFMLHQIRHMVATALGVAAGHLPLQSIEACLCVCARARLPLAPPANLLLCDAEFFPMKRPRLKGGVRGYAQELVLPVEGAARRREFNDGVLAPARADEVADADFVAWAQEELPWRCARLRGEGGLEGVLQAHAAWLAARQEAGKAKARGAHHGPRGAKAVGTSSGLSIQQAPETTATATQV